VSSWEPIVLRGGAAVKRPAPDFGDTPELIDACRRGERSALEQLLRAHTRDVERLIVRLVGPGPDVEDLLQLVLIAAVGAFPRFRGEASVRTWMARIVVNVVREHLRRPERKRKVSLELVPEEPAIDTAPADQQLDHRRRLARLYHHLDALPAKQRIAFVLHVFEGRALDEIAALMGASLAATKSRVFLARRFVLGRARKDPRLADLFPELEKKS
jgi:RNA polymerase sigma-70 factor (ECF subfamily)